MEDRILTCFAPKGRPSMPPSHQLTRKNHISSDICLYIYIYHDLTPSPIPNLHDRCYEFIVVENFIIQGPGPHVGLHNGITPQFAKSWRFDTPMGHGCDFPLGSHGRALGRIFSCSAPMWSADLYRLVTRRGMKIRKPDDFGVRANMIKAIVRTKSKIINFFM